MAKIEGLAVKLLRRDKEALRRLAEDEGESMSTLVRRLIREAARKHGLLPRDGGGE